MSHFQVPIDQPASMVAASGEPLLENHVALKLGVPLVPYENPVQVMNDVPGLR